MVETSTVPPGLTREGLIAFYGEVTHADSPRRTTPPFVSLARLFLARREFGYICGYVAFSKILPPRMIALPGSALHRLSVAPGERRGTAKSNRQFFSHIVRLFYQNSRMAVEQ